MSLGCNICATGVSGADKVKEVSVMEGESVTLFSSVTEVQRTDDIRWKFGADGALMALVDNNQITLFNGSDGRFRRRLQLDHQTASLTINNITKTHAGLYQLTINKGQNIPDKKFNLTVFTRLQVPVIRAISFTNFSSSSSTSVQNCSAVCSVVNVTAVSLFWYKGNRVLYNTSTSDLSASLSLPLEIDCLDDSYSCVVAYLFTNQTEHLNTNLCQPCSEGSSHSCGFTEAVIRLAFSALVGMATLAVLVYDITSTNIEEKIKEQTS